VKINERMQQLAGITEGKQETEARLWKALEKTWYGSDPESDGKPTKNPQPNKFKGNERRFKVSVVGNYGIIELKDTAASHLPAGLTTAVTKAGGRAGRHMESIRATMDVWNKVFKSLRV
jgi:hypothetical protein